LKVEQIEYQCRKIIYYLVGRRGLQDFKITHKEFESDIDWIQIELLFDESWLVMETLLEGLDWLRPGLRQRVPRSVKLYLIINGKWEEL